MAKKTKKTQQSKKPLKKTIPLFPSNDQVPLTAKKLPLCPGFEISLECGNMPKIGQIDVNQQCEHNPILVNAGDIKKERTPFEDFCLMRPFVGDLLVKIAYGFRKTCERIEGEGIEINKMINSNRELRKIYDLINKSLPKYFPTVNFEISTEESEE